MTFSDFRYSTSFSLKLQVGQVRPGRLIFNYLKEIRPDIAQLVQDKEFNPCNLDCLDSKTQNLLYEKFWSFVKDNWDCMVM